MTSFSSSTSSLGSPAAQTHYYPLKSLTKERPRSLGRRPSDVRQLNKRENPAPESATTALMNELSQKLAQPRQFPAKTFPGAVILSNTRVTDIDNDKTKPLQERAQAFKRALAFGKVASLVRQLFNEGLEDVDEELRVHIRHRIWELNGHAKDAREIFEANPFNPTILQAVQDYLDGWRRPDIQGQARALKELLEAHGDESEVQSFFNEKLEDMESELRVHIRHRIWELNGHIRDAKEIFEANPFNPTILQAVSDYLDGWRRPID